MAHKYVTRILEKAKDMRTRLTQTRQQDALPFPFPVWYTVNGHEYVGVAREMQTSYDALERPFEQVFIEYFIPRQDSVIPLFSTGWVLPEQLEVMV